MQGIVCGTVKENYDKDHPGKIKAEIPSLAAEGSETCWASVASPYAGKEYGSYFMPEIGDTVLIAFINGDIQSPVVIGSIWDKSRPVPKEAPNEKNEIKAIESKGGHIVLFNDGEKGGVTIKTKSGLFIELLEDGKAITISHEDKKQKIILDNDKGSITINAEKKIEIKAEEIVIEGKLAVKGDKIQLEADGGLELKGRTLKAEGNSVSVTGQSVKINAKSSGEFSSSAILTLKGSITKIN